MHNHNSNICIYHYGKILMTIVNSSAISINVYQLYIVNFVYAICIVLVIRQFSIIKIISKLNITVSYILICHLINLLC